MSKCLVRTIKGEGIHPGRQAPDFELESTDGERVRLSRFHGRPVVLHFGSITWPITSGGVPPLKQLYEQHQDRVQFVDVFIRQAHPGECRGAYSSYEEKMQSAREYKREEGIPWLVLIDDLAGTVHTTYSDMADPVFLIDATGQASFYGMWTHGPKLKEAIDELLAQGGKGAPVAGGIDRMPHILASFVNGWHGLKRGCWRAVLDYELSVPGAATLTFLGNLAKPLLAPIALRSTPLPMATRLALGGGLAMALALVVWLLRRRD